MKRLFTSESVTSGHPDKICDQIADAVLDECMRQDPESRVACEVAINTGLVLVMGEITTKATIDIPVIVKRTIKNIGYCKEDDGFGVDTAEIKVSLLLNTGGVLLTHAAISFYGHTQASGWLFERFHH